MKIALYFFCFLLCNRVISQTKPFKINGVIHGLNNGSVKLLYSQHDTNFKVFEDSVILDNGKFTFNGLTPYPFAAYVYLIGQRRSDLFFIDPDTQSIELKIDSFFLKPKSNSITNKEFVNNYLSKFSILQEDFDKLILKISNDSIESKRKQLQEKKNSLSLNYIYHNPKSYAVFWSMYHAFESRGYSKIFDSAFNLFDITLRRTPVGLYLEDQISMSRNTIQGSFFPTFYVVDSNDVKSTLELSGKRKYTLIDFWFHNCGPCIRQFSDFKKIYTKFSSIDFDILGISIDDEIDKAKWLNAINKYELPWPQYWDKNHIQSSKYSIKSFPTNFLLDINGKILFKNIEPRLLENFLLKNIYPNKANY